jgi:hypothetical protein
MSTAWRRLFLGLLVTPAAAKYIPFNEYQYCVIYFGSIEATLYLPDGGVPEKNYNGTATCPRKWEFPTTVGATFQLCPPFGGAYTDESRDHIALDATLSFRGAGQIEISRPVDYLMLRDLLITNGTVTGPFSAGGTPAVIVEDKAQSDLSRTTWTINGTQGAVIDETLGGNVFFSCQNLTPEQLGLRYCGNDLDQQDGGCFFNQMFRFNMQLPLNFTMTFTSTRATVDLFAEMPYNKTAFNSVAQVSFTGTTDFPSVTYYDFWNNAEKTYEQYQLLYNKYIKLVPDKNGLPVFWNDTDTGEWYATSNQTFSKPSAGARAGRIIGALPLAVLAASLFVTTIL